MLDDIFLKNLFLKCFWSALRNEKFDCFILLRGCKRCFLCRRVKNNLLIENYYLSTINLLIYYYAKI